MTNNAKPPVPTFRSFRSQRSKAQRIVTQAKALEAQILKDLTNAFTVSAHLDEALMNTEAHMRREEMTHPSSSLLTVLET